MDDEAIFGPEFHRLGFGQAVEQDLLADYRVLILTVDESFIATGWQSLVADENNEITLDDAARIVGCWNGLAKRSQRTTDPITGHTIGFAPGEPPMRRAVAFSHTIAASKALATKFADVTQAYTGEHAPTLRCEVDHVDGTMNSLTRNRLLAWLKEPTDPDTCRILSNARCLSEGVDVPTLDAVLFLTPRNSVVDVVQSVGRVMRKAEDKQYGYIILPVAIPAGVPPEEALKDNERYKVVWQVLQALRAHDDRFNATINKIDLNRDPARARSRSSTSPTTGTKAGPRVHTQGAFTFPVESSPTRLRPDRDQGRPPHLLGAMGQRCGGHRPASRRPASRHLWPTQPQESKSSSTSSSKASQATINPGITSARRHRHARPAPHHQAGLRRPLRGYDFAAQPRSQAMQAMLDVLDEQAWTRRLETLEEFYASVRQRAEGIDNAEGKQRIIIELYDKFFKTAFPKMAEHWALSTPPSKSWTSSCSVSRPSTPAANSAQASRRGHSHPRPVHRHRHLHRAPAAKRPDQRRRPGPQVRQRAARQRDRAAGLLHRRGQHRGRLLRTLGREGSTAVDGRYQPFPGIVLADTFQMSESATLDHEVFTANNERAQQLEHDITRHHRQPPLLGRATSMNDDNANLKYPTLDAAIETTYAAASTAPQELALRLVHPRLQVGHVRIGDRTAWSRFVSNGGWIDANTADGMRKSLADEYDHIYIYNLRGNQRTAGELSRREGGKVFGSGSRNTVAITLLVKTGQPRTGSSAISYHDIGSYLTREQNLALVDGADLDTLAWQTITPNPKATGSSRPQPRLPDDPTMGISPEQAAGRCSPRTPQASRPTETPGSTTQTPRPSRPMLGA